MGFGKVFGIIAFTCLHAILFVEVVHTLLQCTSEKRQHFVLLQSNEYSAPISVSWVLGRFSGILQLSCLGVVLVRKAVQTLFQHIPKKQGHLCFHWNPPFFSFRSLFCGYWKKNKFLLSSSISVCNSCAEFVSEIFVQLIWFCAVQSFVINCFFWRSFRQKTLTSKEGFRQTSWTWNVHVGFNCCYYCTQLVQFRYDVLKTVVTRREPDVRVAAEHNQKLDAHPSMPKISENHWSCLLHGCSFWIVTLN